MPRPDRPYRVAAVEFNPEMFEFDRNVERACAAIRDAAEQGAKLIVLPEAALSGYIYRDLTQFLPYMDEVPGRATAAIEEVTRQYGCYVAVGIAEVDPSTGLTYNTGALVGPDGFVGKYRKNGLNPSDIQWFVPGNTGYPVFDTELGRITMIICYDDTYWEPGRLAAIKGADLVAYICSSDRVLPELGAEAAGNHSTIAAVQQLCAWNGLAMVAADRCNAETNPTTGVTVTYGGAASIWQADGRRVAHAPATDANLTLTNRGTTLFAEIDPGLFENGQKDTLTRRRPDLYGPLAFWRGPTDPVATAHGVAVRLAALQYRVRPGDFDGNVEAADAQVRQLQDAGVESGLVVLPAFSFGARPATADEAAESAESALGRSVQVAGDFAARLGSHVVVSHVERDSDLFHTAVLVGPDGTVVGRYRQTHLDPADPWFTPGDDLPVFPTSIGRVGLLVGDDVRFPEASGVLSVRRADLVAIPSAWRGDWGGHLHDAEGLFADQYPANTMALWYAIAKTSQAYTVAANPVADGYAGSSGVFSINPVDSDEPPVVASVDAAGPVVAHVTTLGRPGWWLDQERLVNGRRADLVVPATLDVQSEAFRRWWDSPGWDDSGWTAYRP
ncbi:MAG: nitrilase-related carbon-nitrogen hydrolase [Candidatus Nanopelagicales bacterium]